jgi:hypothetical protein
LIGGHALKRVIAEPASGLRVTGVEQHRRPERDESRCDDVRSCGHVSTPFRFRA